MTCYNNHNQKALNKSSLKYFFSKKSQFGRLLRDRLKSVCAYVEKVWVVCFFLPLNFISLQFFSVFEFVFVLYWFYFLFFFLHTCVICETNRRIRVLKRMPSTNDLMNPSQPFDSRPRKSKQLLHEWFSLPKIAPRHYLVGQSRKTDQDISELFVFACLYCVYCLFLIVTCFVVTINKFNY